MQFEVYQGKNGVWVLVETYTLKQLWDYRMEYRGLNFRIYNLRTDEWYVIDESGERTIQCEPLTL